MGPSAFPVWRGSNSVSSQANHLEDGRGRCLLNLYCYITEDAASTGSTLALRQRWYTPHLSACCMARVFTRCVGRRRMAKIPNKSGVWL